MADPPRIVAGAQSVERLSMFNVYVLKSLKNNKRYVGFTSKDLTVRLSEHNEGKNSYTRNNRLFKLIYSEAFSEEQDARRREKFLKTGNGRKCLDNIIPP